MVFVRAGLRGAGARADRRARPLTIPPILLGLWIWSTEFAWADRQLERAKARVAWPGTTQRRRPVLSAVVTGGGPVALGVAIWLGARYELVARAREVVGV
jgi:hypothetical protein